MNTPIFLEPAFKEIIWGGSNIRDCLGYDAPEGKIGECWAISGHPHRDCKVLSQPYAGMTLGQLYAQHRELFGGCTSQSFPLLTKIIDAHDDLSIQVHPDDAYANEHENGASGKAECWYILGGRPNATIILGQGCKTKEEFAQKAKANKWDEILFERPIWKDDFMQINPGTVHAIKAGTILLEVQQSSDVTYRIYDYDRLQDGKPRKLHFQQALDVIDFGMQPLAITSFADAGAGATTLESNDKFSVELVNVCGSYELRLHDNFACCNVIEGEGSVITDGDVDGDRAVIADDDGFGASDSVETKISANTNFVLPSTIKNCTFTGNLKVIVSRSNWRK